MAALLSGGAGLIVRSLFAITSIDSGFDATRLLRAQVSLPSGSYAEDAQVWNFYDRVLEKLSAAPGVSHAAVMSGLPRSAAPTTRRSSSTATRRWITRRSTRSSSSSTSRRATWRR